MSKKILMSGIARFFLAGGLWAVAAAIVFTPNQGQTHHSGMMMEASGCSVELNNAIVIELAIVASGYATKK